MNLLKGKQQNQAKSPKGQAKKPVPELKQSKSPNLLQSTIRVQSSQTDKQQFRVSKVAFILIVLIQVLFVFLSLFNSRTISQIENTQKNIKRQEAAVLSKNFSEERIRDVLIRTETLKRLEKERVLFGPKILGFIDALPAEVFLKRSFIKENEMSLTIETKSPLEISLLIANYFDQGFAEEIIILAANLNRTEGVFVTTLEIIF